MKNPFKVRKQEKSTKHKILIDFDDPELEYDGSDNFFIEPKKKKIIIKKKSEGVKKKAKDNNELF